MTLYTIKRSLITHSFIIIVVVVGSRGKKTSRKVEIIRFEASNKLHTRLDARVAVKNSFFQSENVWENELEKPTSKVEK